ncbi:MAG: CoA transferase [Alphaproteobacteria bacterium]|nr:CoA transferase [Alphaproteobacteria bacterium]
MGPLAGLKVLDLSHVMAGPTCALMLADMGADVIKVEKIPGGDDVRKQVPPKVGDEPASFLMMNRNKRGLALDLKKPGGKRVLERLVRGADVLIENYAPGTMDKLGFGWDVLKGLNPALVYCTVTGFGGTGPYAHRRGFDLVAQAMSGIMSFTGEGPGRAPVKCGAPLTDITAGILAAMGVLAAYTHRLKTGQGQRVDTSLFEAGIVHTYWQSAIAFATGVAPAAMGSAHPLSAPYQAFETADGWLVVGGANQNNWLRLVEALEAPELLAEPRFKENRDRITNLALLETTLAPYFRKRKTAEWLAIFDAKGLPCGPVNDVKQMHTDPQAIAREMVIEVDHATLGKVKTLGAPVKFSDTPGGVRRGAPLFGQHSREVLAEFGFSGAEIDALFTEEAVQGP